MQTDGADVYSLSTHQLSVLLQTDAWPVSVYSLSTHQLSVLLQTDAWPVSVYSLSTHQLSVLCADGRMACLQMSIVCLPTKRVMCRRTPDLFADVYSLSTHQAC